ncbi:hypothetical protein FA014_11245 [Cellulomonas hominis]|uniref:ATPase n=1 Tax=Cellulomonas hominis TaxID=156981 RepID=A0A7Z8K0U0_9CELL|nr:hypothetical protein [Cellulomonas hominis]TKR23430.1 hypothetical protein FA014_11245 [Cellulomonas hominis]
MTEQTTPGAQGRPEGLRAVLDALEQAVQVARAVPMSASVLVSRAELLDLVEQARAALPTQIGRADEVLAAADAERAAARADAERIEAQARRRAAELVEQESVVAQAAERAAEIVREAEETARALRRDADDYCDRRLADFEIDLGKVLTQVQAGRAKLADRLEDGEG